jgi:hypothetical protein
MFIVFNNWRIRPHLFKSQSTHYQNLEQTTSMKDVDIENPMSWPWTALKEDWGPYQIGEEDRTTK